MQRTKPDAINFLAHHVVRRCQRDLLRVTSQICESAYDGAEVGYPEALVIIGINQRLEGEDLMSH
jgi:hypothetical protein